MVSLEVPEPLELGLASLDLVSGETRTIHLFAPLEGKAKAYRVELAGHETVETPAGSFEARRLEIRDTEGSDDQTDWIASDAGRGGPRRGSERSGIRYNRFFSSGGRTGS
jgi:hypothetical protein